MSIYLGKEWKERKKEKKKKKPKKSIATRRI